MFWKKGRISAAPVAEATISKAQPSAPKAKKLSAREIITNHIEQLTLGQEARFKIPELYGIRPAKMIYVKIKDGYAGKGSKYSLSQDDIINGEVAGKKDGNSF